MIVCVIFIVYSPLPAANLKKETPKHSVNYLKKIRIQLLEIKINIINNK
jgi:hypothetical protein